MSLLAQRNFLPSGIHVHRDDFARQPDGDPCIRVAVQRESDRLTYVFDVPIYKKLVMVKVGGFLFPRYEEREVTDDDRIAGELRERGYWAVQWIATASNQDRSPSDGG